ncbi:MAG: aspartate--tRNA ligase [Christensenellales bacterium]|jgi:aspartyl-tRNA synthetase
MKRTAYCGALTEADVGRRITAMGWVANKRDMGGVIFLDLRDREGELQVVVDAGNLPADQFALAESVRLESVFAATGTLRIRDADTYNPRLKTGTIELEAAEVALLSQAARLPFPLEEAGGVREELRLKYRFLDLRRPQMQRNLRFRAQLAREARDYLDRAGFLEVETPMLTKSTPEGARDYLVPSRARPGAFYALPQSPQIFKQLLMVGGVDRYYQIARCFRDEDLRADRQPEFTQVDMELSFVDQEDILTHLEALFKHLFARMMGRSIAEPFPRLTWREAMDRYGSDKPDLRFGLPIVELTELMADCAFSVFRRAVEQGGRVRAINAKGCAGFSRGVIEALTDKALGYGAKGMAWIAIREDGEPYSILTKYFTPPQWDALMRAVDGRPGDFILFCADQQEVVLRTLGGLRLDLAELLGLRRGGEFRFVLVTDFPQFEWSQSEGRFLATHHPFTMPYPEDVPYLLSDPARVRAQAFDVVLNGVELGSGSIRIHDQQVQRAMFQALGFDEEQIQERFGFMVNAFQYGTPPHGGFAFGLDRLAMQLLQAESLREVIAFPKNKEAACLMTDAPGPVDAEQLAALGLTGGAPAARTPAQRPERPRLDLDRVAALSRLRIDPADRDRLTGQLRGIIAFADELAQIDTAGVPETVYAAPLQNVLREDKARPGMDREALLANAPQRREGYLLVPQVVE